LTIHWVIADWGIAAFVIGALAHWRIGALAQPDRVTKGVHAMLANVNRSTR
jgi:hypothetical protein